MKKFILLFPLFFTILLFVLFVYENPLSNSINTFQREILLDMLRWWFDERVVGHYIYINPLYSLTIDKACNGMVSIIIFWASILAYPSPWLQKIFWLMIGYIVISLSNFLRIVFVSYMVMEDSHNFSWSHDVVGNGFLMAISLLIFFRFLQVTRDRLDKTTFF